MRAGFVALTVFAAMAFVEVACVISLKRLYFRDLLDYVFLRAGTGFPSRLTDLDLVFLVPRPWIAPVWLACLGSLLCAAGAQVLSRWGGSSRWRKQGV